MGSQGAGPEKAHGVQSWGVAVGGVGLLGPLSAVLAIQAGLKVLSLKCLKVSQTWAVI